jgi:hypothetical protein
MTGTAKYLESARLTSVDAISHLARCPSEYHHVTKPRVRCWLRLPLPDPYVLTPPRFIKLLAEHVSIAISYLIEMLITIFLLLFSFPSCATRKILIATAKLCPITPRTIIKVLQEGSEKNCNDTTDLEQTGIPQ